METLIGIIVAIVILIFKAVGKKMDDAARKAAPRPTQVPDWAEIFEQEYSNERPVPQIFKSEPEPEPEPELMPDPEPLFRPEPVVAPEVVQTHTPLRKPQTASNIVTEASREEKKKEKIDPKKLIVYSEIMNRKY